MTISRSTGDHRCTSKLFPLFRMEGDRYALDTHEVVEVLPLLCLRRIPEASEWVAGMFSRHGVLVPMLDLRAMTFSRVVLIYTSTRIVLAEYRTRQEREPAWFGLIPGQTTDTLRCKPSMFRDYGLDDGRARYFSPVYEGSRGLVQWMRVEALLPDGMRALLFPPECGERAA